MIVDTVPLGYGPEVLLLRLRTLADVVDRHVIVEADLTHTGEPREPLWPQLLDDPRFAEHAHRVEWFWEETPRLIRAPLGREEWLRDRSLQLVHELGLDGSAYVLLADADEVPNPGALAMVRLQGHDRARLYGRYHEWWLDWRAHGGPYRWEFRQPLMFRLSAYSRQVTGSHLRASQMHGHPKVKQIGWPGDPGAPIQGWHFTLQGGAEACVHKLRSFAHVELAELGQDEIQVMINEQVDILGRAPLKRVPVAHLPAPVREDMTTFGPLLSWAGWTEAFSGSAQAGRAGQAAYEAYVRGVGGRSAVTGNELVAWDQQSRAVKQAWSDAAAAVLKLREIS